LLRQPELAQLFGSDLGALAKFRIIHEKFIVDNIESREQPDIELNEPQATQPTITPGQLQQDVDLSFEEDIASVGEVLSTSFDFAWELDLKTVLKQSLEGRSLLLRSNFDIVARKRLTRIIIAHFLDNNVAMGTTEFRTVSRKIVSLFPFETIDEYFIPAKETSGKSKVAGSLPDHYYNKKRRYVTDGILRKMEKKLATPANDTVSGSNEVDQIDFLRFNTSPEAEVIEKWIGCMQLRQTTDKNLKLFQIFEKYPFLASSEGYKLVSSQLFPFSLYFSFF
jgi:hypothetical protein